MRADDVAMASPKKHRRRNRGWREAERASLRLRRGEREEDDAEKKFRRARELRDGDSEKELQCSQRAARAQRRMDRLDGGRARSAASVSRPFSAAESVAADVITAANANVGENALAVRF